MSRKIERLISREQRKDARELSTAMLVRYLAESVKYAGGDLERGMYGACAAELNERFPAPVGKPKRRRGPCGTGHSPPVCMGSAHHGPKGCTCTR